MSSTLKDKDAGLHFIIDNTPPQIVMDGIEAGGIYDASQKKVNVMFSDNGMLTEARLSLHNDKGEEISSWDYMELATAEKPLMLEIAEMIETVLSNVENEAVIAEVRARVNKTMEKYPLFAY